MIILVLTVLLLSSCDVENTASEKRDENTVTESPQTNSNADNTENAQINDDAADTAEESVPAGKEEADITKELVEYAAKIEGKWYLVF